MCFKVMVCSLINSLCIPNIFYSTHVWQVTHLSFFSQLEVIRNDADAANALLRKELEEKVDVLKQHAQSSEKKIQELSTALTESQHSAKELKNKHEEVLATLEQVMIEKKELNAHNLELKVRSSCVVCSTNLY